MSLSPDKLMQTFEADIREFVLRTLPYDHAIRPDLETQRDSDLLIIYLNWRKRLILKRPRTLHASFEFTANPLLSDAAYADPLAHIQNLIRSGGDLFPHLSERVSVGYEKSAKPTFNRRRDLDLMLYDWEVYHLHLSTAPWKDGFVQRTGPLLFAVFKPDDGYLIDIFPHGAWTRNRIFEIMVDNWPKAGLVREMPGILDVERDLSEEDRAMLRSAGINSNRVKRNGKILSIGGGLTSAGTSAQCSISALRIMRALSSWAKHLAANPKTFSELIQGAGLETHEQEDVHVMFHEDDRPYLCDRASKVAFPLWS